MSEEFIKVTDTRTHGHTHRQTEPLPELLSELKIITEKISILRNFCLGHNLA